MQLPATSRQFLFMVVGVPAGARLFPSEGEGIEDEDIKAKNPFFIGAYAASLSSALHFPDNIKKTLLCKVRCASELKGIIK